MRARADKLRRPSGRHDTAPKIKRLSRILRRLMISAESRLPTSSTIEPVAVHEIACVFYNATLRPQPRLLRATLRDNRPLSADPCRPAGPPLPRRCSDASSCAGRTKGTWSSIVCAIIPTRGTRQIRGVTRGVNSVRCATNNVHGAAGAADDCSLASLIGLRSSPIADRSS